MNDPHLPAAQSSPLGDLALVEELAHVASVEAAMMIRIGDLFAGGIIGLVLMLYALAWTPLP